jgi:DNA-binding GntR family transcriptional regulator
MILNTQTVNPDLEREGPIPIYQQLKDWMRDQIVSGAWSHNHKLPAEADLAVAWEISRGTVRKAIAELTEEGLLRRTHGRGTFVASDVLEQALANRMETFSEDLIRRGIPFATEVLEQQIIRADERLSTWFRSTVGTPILRLKRVRLVGREPLILLHNYVLLLHCQGIEHLDFQEIRLFEALEEHFHLEVLRGRRTFQAIAADKQVAARLDLPALAPVMYIEQQSFLKDGAPVEVSNLWLRGDRFKLSAEVQRNQLIPTTLSVSAFTD